MKNNNLKISDFGLSSFLTATLTTYHYYTMKKNLMQQNRYCLYFLIQKTKYFCSNDKRNYKTCKRRKCPDQLHLVVMKI